MTAGRPLHPDDAAALNRVLEHVRALGGELVLTRAGGFWRTQVIVGADTLPAEQREVAFGHGKLGDALRALLEELPPASDRLVLA